MSQQTKHSNQEIVDQLSAISSNSERIRALIQSGIASNVLAKAIGVSSRSVKNWQNEQSEPYFKSAYCIDDIRFVMEELIEVGEMEPQDAANWLQSRQDHEADFVRPIELIKDNPMSVIELVRGQFPRTNPRL